MGRNQHSSPRLRLTSHNEVLLLVPHGLHFLIHITNSNYYTGILLH
jgi:hypothetical protein